MAATIPLHLPYQDTDGSPLNGGYIYFGVENQNAITNPIAVYWDSAMTQPAAQPIRTLNGYTVNNGNIARVFVASKYSIIVRNITQQTVYSEMSSDLSAASIYADDGSGGSLWTTVQGFINKIFSSSGSSVIGFLQAGSGAIARTVQAKLRDTVSVMDFGAVGDGVTDDTASLQAALNTGKTVLIPENITLKVTATVFISAGASIVGASNQTSKILLSGAAWTTAGSNQVAIAIGCASAGSAASPWYGRINRVQFITDSASKFNRAICDFASKRAEITDCVFDFTLGLGWTSPHAGGSMGSFTSSVNPSWASGFNLTDFGSIVFERNTAICSANQVSSEGFGFVGYSSASIRDNKITGIGDDPIALHGVYNAIVQNNYVTSTDGRIYIDSCQNIAISDNTLQRCLGADGRWWSTGSTMIRTNGEWAANLTAVPNANITVRNNRLHVPSTLDSLSASCPLASWMTFDGVQRGLTVENNTIHNDSAGITTSVPSISVVPVVQAGWTGPAGNPDFAAGGIVRCRDIMVQNNRVIGSVATGGVSMAGTASNYLGPTLVESNSFDRYQLPGTVESHLAMTNRSATGDAATFQAVSPVVLYRNPTVDFFFTGLTDASTSGSPMSLTLDSGGSFVTDLGGRVCGAVLLLNAIGTSGRSAFLRILKNGVQIGSDLSNQVNIKRRLYSYNNVAGMTFAAGDEITVQLYCDAGQVVSLVGKVKLQVLYN